jgi:hypothetical protein
MAMFSNILELPDFMGPNGLDAGEASFLVPVKKS